MKKKEKGIPLKEKELHSGNYNYKNLSEAGVLGSEVEAKVCTVNRRRNTDRIGCAVEM